MNGTTYQYQTQYAFTNTDVFNPLSTGLYQTNTYQDSLLIRDRTNDNSKYANISTTFWEYPYYNSYKPIVPFFKGTVVRALAVKPNSLPSKISTNSYFISPLERNRYEDITVVSLSINEDYLFDYNIGTYVPGATYENLRLNNPNLNVNGGTNANHHRRGVQWEYPLNIEIFDKNSNTQLINQVVGSRIHGDFTRARARKSLRLYARNEYGKSTFEAKLFENLNDDSFKRLILRNGGNNEHILHYRDVAMQEMVKTMNVDILHTTPSVHFINGEFWGFINIRERYDQHYFKRVHDIEENEVDYLTGNQEVVLGNSLHYSQTINYLNSNNIADSSHYAYIKTRINVENFADYQITNIFLRNTDWPTKNVDFFRKKINYDSTAPYPIDGRWNWLVFDTDHGFGFADNPQGSAYNHNTLNYATSGGWAQTVIRRLLLNNDFENHFINRFADMLNTIFLPNYTLNIIDSVHNIYEPFQLEHMERRHNHGTDYTGFLAEVDYMRTFAEERPAAQRNHLRSKFQLGQNFNLNVDVSDENHGYVKVNTINILASTAGIDAPVYPWDGIYFKNHPVEFTAIAKPGYIFSHWIGLTQTDEYVSQAFNTDSVNITAVFMQDTLAPPDSLVIHYWHFNALPSGNLSIVAADSSKVGLAFLEYDGVGAGYMDAVNEGSLLNLHFNETEGEGLRVRNPSEERALVLHMPTKGYKDIVLNYAVKRTNNGVEKQVVQYKTSSSTNWTTIGDTIFVDTDYLMETLDFSNIQAVNDNPEFKVRILFEGSNITNASGNNRFDNISLSGVPTPCASVLAHYFHFNNLPNGNLSTVVSDYSITSQNANIEYLGSGLGFLDDVNDGSIINLQLNETDGKGLRVRNPSDTRSLIFSIPTDGVLNPKLSYAVKRTNFGATQQQISYRKDNSSNWVSLPNLIDVTPDYTLQTIDFSGINDANNNPNFQVKIDFTGQNANASSGNNRFDNLAVFGDLVDVDTLTEVLCQGNVYSFYNQFITSSGFYNHVFQDSSGCDSLLLILDLSIQSVDTSIYIETCDNSYFFNGETITENGLYTDTLQSGLGCDSVVYLTLTFSQTITNITDTVCGTYTFAGNTLNSSGIYTDTLQNFSGCDSIIVLDLTIFDNQTTIFDTVCESTVFGGQLLTQSGTYYDTLYNINNCNEVFLTYHLEVLQPSDTMIYETTCDTFVYNGNILTQSGTYYYNYTNQGGCDSLVSLVLDVDMGVNVVLQINGHTLSAADTSFENYQWLDCEDNFSPISGANSPVFEVTENGIYALSVQQNGCWSTSSCIAINDVSTQEVFENEYIQLYPNPNSGQFSIKFDGLKVASQINIEIYNALGQLVYSENSEASGVLLKEINLNKKAQGVYFVHINVNENRYHRKVVINE